MEIEVWLDEHSLGTAAEGTEGGGSPRKPSAESVAVPAKRELVWLSQSMGLSERRALKLVEMIHRHKGAVNLYKFERMSCATVISPRLILETCLYFAWPIRGCQREDVCASAC